MLLSHAKYNHEYQQKIQYGMYCRDIATIEVTKAAALVKLFRLKH